MTDQTIPTTSDNTPSGTDDTKRWIVQRGDEQFVATSLAELRAWALERRLLASDRVLDPDSGEWKMALSVTGHGEAPVTARSSFRKPVLVAVSLVVLLPLLGIGSCVAYLLVIGGIEAARPAQLHARLTMTSPAYGDAVVKNVSSTPLKNVSIRFAWDGDRALMEQELGDVQPGQEVHVTIQPQQNDAKSYERNAASSYSSESWATMSTSQRLSAVNAISAGRDTDTYLFGMALSKKPTLSAKAGSDSVKVDLLDETADAVRADAERSARERMKEVNDSVRRQRERSGR